MPRQYDVIIRIFPAPESLLDETVGHDGQDNVGTGNSVGCSQKSFPQ